MKRQRSENGAVGAHSTQLSYTNEHLMAETLSAPAMFVCLKHPHKTGGSCSEAVRMTILADSFGRHSRSHRAPSRDRL